MDCFVKKPYPDIKVEKENSYYAKLLLEDYAGLEGELSAITQYSYETLDIFMKYPQVSKELEKIAMVEMRHLEILGKIIKLLGLKPEYKYYNSSNNYYTYWNASSLDYNTDIKEILLNDIRIERIAIANYEFHINLINDKYIKKILYRIVEDEILHIECFKELLKDYL